MIQNGAVLYVGRESSCYLLLPNFPNKRFATTYLFRYYFKEVNMHRVIFISVEDQAPRGNLTK